MIRPTIKKIILIPAAILLIICTVVVLKFNTPLYVSGTVLDFTNKNPISGVAVEASQVGWGIRNEGIVWDKRFSYTASTDKNGKFKVYYPLRFSLVNSVYLTVSSSGYSNFNNHYAPNSKVVIYLQPKPESYKKLPSGVLQMGLENFKPYGWNFETAKITFDSTEADVFPTLTDCTNLKTNFTFSALGGVVFYSADKVGVVGDLLVYTDQAPLINYRLKEELNFAKQSGVYFIKTQDGGNYAKFDFYPDSFTGIGSEADFKKGTCGLMLDYIYNPSGSLDLTYRK